MNEEQIRRLESQVDWILQDVGLAFRDDPSSLALWQREGAQVDGDIVRAPADWIRALCRQALSRFTHAACEPADSMHWTMLAGANFELHAAGWLEGGMCTGFENLVMDADRLGGYQKILNQGLDTSEKALARDAYAEVAPGGHFLGCAHTIRNYQTAFYEPKLSDNDNVESWEEGGSKDMRQRAYDR